MGSILGICGMQRCTSPGMKNKQKTGENSGRHYMPYNTRHHTSARSYVWQLVVMGITGKAQKWCRHRWQGSVGPVGHVDL